MSGFDARYGATSGKVAKMQTATRELIAADCAKVATRDIAAEIAALNTAIETAYSSNDYSKLAVLSQQMLKLKAEQSREATAQLEAKLLPDVAELLDVYSIELVEFVELRVHLADGLVKAVTLHNIVATPKASTKATTSTSNRSNGASTQLLAKHGDCVNSKAFKAGGVEFPAGATYNELDKIAHSAPDKKNAVWKLLEHLRAHDTTHS